jgi:type VI protein secretion system component VasF
MNEVPLWLAGLILALLFVLMFLHHEWRYRRRNNHDGG